MFQEEESSNRLDDWTGVRLSPQDPNARASAHLPSPGREEGRLVSSSDITEDSFVVPLLDQAVAAGKSSSLGENDTITGYIRLPTRLRSYGLSLAALPVRGDSMYPTIDDDDVVVCDNGGWNGEGIYVIRLDGESLVKRLSKRPAGVMVISDNTRYPAFEVSEEAELDVVGRVRAVVKLMD